MTGVPTTLSTIQRERQTQQALNAFRHEVIAQMLAGMRWLGAFVTLAAVITALQRGEWPLALVYAVAYALILTLTLWRTATDNLRAGLLCVLLFLFGTYELVLRGQPILSLAFFLPAVWLTAAFFDRALGAAALGVSLLTWVLTGSLVVDGRLAIGFAPEFSTPNAWLLGGAALACGGAFALLAAISHAHALETGLQRQQARQTEFEQDQARLQAQVERQTVDLERRLVQLNTAAEISRTISAELDPAKVLQTVVDLVQTRFDYYYVGVFLVDERGEYAHLQAGTGEAGRKMIEQNHRLAIGGNSMIGWAVANQQGRIALDVGLEAVRFENPHLPETRSELALPIRGGGRALGAMTFQSNRPSAFDQTDITLLQGISDSLATALQNAQLFAELQTKLDEIRGLHRQYLAQAWSEIPYRGDELSYTYDAQCESSGGDARLEVPLTLRDQVIGAVTLEGINGTLSDEERQFVEAVTTQAALALENARLLETTQRRAERERLATQISGRLWASSDVDTILRTVLQELGRALSAAEGTIQLELEQ
jgi:GAF domain-containing protein